MEVNIILIKFAEYAQLEVYNFKISQHDLPVINRKLPESIGSTINVPTTVRYCIHSNKFHSVKILSLLGTYSAGDQVKSSKRFFSAAEGVYVYKDETVSQAFLKV